MAAVTVTKQYTNVNGSLREKYVTINIATSGDTFDTKFKILKSVNFNDVAITKAAVSAGIITFTTTGAVTGALVVATGS